MDRKTVLLVDDHPMIRALFEALINAEGLQVCGEASGVFDAVSLAQEHEPGMAVVDISLDGGNGLDLVRRLKNAVPGIAILVCSSHDERLYGPRAIEAGAQGYISKKVDPAQISEAIRAVSQGGVWFSDELRERGDGSGEGVGAVDSLSNKELEVFRLIANGLSSGEIASQLGRSVKTIESHRENIKRKLGISSASELVQYAVRWGLEQA